MSANLTALDSFSALNRACNIHFPAKPFIKALPR